MEVEMKVERSENMTGTGIERLQRWAAFSVKAHRDLGSLAADLLLYDKLILPVPEDDDEFDRWVKNRWNPEEIATTVVKGAGRILPVPWTAQLRAQFDEGWKHLRKLGDEVAYGYTGLIYASSQAAWQEIYKSVYTDEKPARKPALFAGYQSAEEAKAELALEFLDQEAGARRRNPERLPGGRPVDHLVAVQIQRLVHEPAVEDPNEAFDAAVSLVENPAFQQARQGLFDWEDRIFVDDWSMEDAQSELLGWQEAYRDAVQAHVVETRMRWASTVLPKVAAWTATASGHPHLAKPASWGAKWVAGKFLPVSDQPGLERHPGAAFEMIRVAYRDQHPLSPDAAKVFAGVIP
jgi:hypothetical protein